MDQTRFKITIEIDHNTPNNKVVIEVPNIMCEGLRDFAINEVACELETLSRWVSTENMMSGLLFSE